MLPTRSLMFSQVSLGSYLTPLVVCLVLCFRLQLFLSTSVGFALVVLLALLCFFLPFFNVYFDDVVLYLATLGWLKIFDLSKKKLRNIL